MLVGIDHLVVVVPHLDEASERLATGLGIEVGSGGVHPTLGTANRLAWFGDSYLELLAITDPGVAAGAWLGRPAMRLLAGHPAGAFVTFALASDDLAGDVAAATAGGSPLSGPLPGERQRPDGEVVRWSLAVPPLIGPGMPPFLIEHDAGGAEWRPTDREARRAAVHPLGGPVRLAALTIAVADPPVVVAAYRSTLGLPRTSVDGGGDPPGLTVTVGAQRIVLRRPGDDVEPPVRIDLMTADGRAGSIDLFGCRFVVRPA